MNHRAKFALPRKAPVAKSQSPAAVPVEAVHIGRVFIDGTPYTPGECRFIGAASPGLEEILIRIENM